MEVTLPPIAATDCTTRKSKRDENEREQVVALGRRERFFLPSVYTEKTEIFTSGKLGNLLDNFYEKFVDVKRSKINKRVHLARSTLRSLVRVMRLTKYPHTVKPSNREPILVSDFLNNTVVSPWKDVEFLLPLIFSASFRKREVCEGYCTLSLPEKLPGAKDVFGPVRSDDKVHLSPKKVYETLYRMLSHAIGRLKIQELSVTLSQTQTDCLDLLLNIGHKVTVHVVPTIVITCKKTFLVASSFDFHMVDSCETKWKYDFNKEEKKLMERVDMADRGVRKKALQIVRALFDMDGRCSAVSAYNLKTCLFHMVEQEIDFYPGWQRKSLCACVVDLLESVLNAMHSKRLPHSQLARLNLCEHIPEVRRKKTIKILERFCAEKGLERALIRILSNGSNVEHLFTSN